MLVLGVFLVLLLLIFINVPIAVSLAVAAIFGLVMTEGAGSLVTVALDMYDGSTKFSLIAIPMFVLAGAIMNAGGITDRLINFVAALIGFVRDVAETVLEVAKNLVAILFSRCIEYALTNFSLHRFHMIARLDDVGHFEDAKLIG